MGIKHTVVMPGIGTHSQVGEGWLTGVSIGEKYRSHVIAVGNAIAYIRKP